MQKIEFKNLPDTSTPINAENLNQVQTNIENAINGVVESGSNENGTYIKYEDGTMICTHGMQPSELNTNYHFNRGRWNYPVAFKTIPQVISTANDWTTYLACTKVYVESTYSEVMTIMIDLLTMTPVDNACNLNLVAIGRWK